MTALRLWKGAVQPPVNGWDVDETVTNLADSTEDLTSGQWTKFRCSVGASSSSVTDDGQAIPLFPVSEDGTSANNHYFQGTNNSVYEVGVTYRISCYAQASNRTWVRLQHNSGPAANCYYNLGSGVTGTASVNVVSGSEGIEDLGSGVYRLWFDFVATAANATPILAIAEADNDIVFDGLSQESVLIGGFQVELAVGTAPRAFVPNPDANVTATARIRSESSTAWPGSHTVKNVIYLHKGAVQPTNIVAATATATPARGGRVRKGTKPKRYIVEIDNQYIEVSNIAEAQAVLMQARELAEQAAERDVKTEVVPKPPRIRVKTIGGNETTSVVLKRDIQKTQKAVLAAYRQAAEAISRDREIARMIQQQMREDDEDDALTALLLM